MKINRKFIKYSSVVLLLLTILPLFLEAGSAAFSIGMITIGISGCLWSFTKIYEELKWSQVKQKGYEKV